VQVPRAHAALAPRDEGEHAKLLVRLFAGEEAGDLVVGQDRAWLDDLAVRAAQLGEAHVAGRVALDELILDGGREEATDRAEHLRAGGAPDLVTENLLLPGLALAAVASRVAAHHLVADVLDVGWAHLVQSHRAQRRERVSPKVGLIVGGEARAEGRCVLGDRVGRAGGDSGRPATAGGKVG
jgi:hypothetical protein